MSSSIYVGRISVIEFQVISGLFYGIAIIAAATRMTLQIRLHRRIQLDDWFLLFACICLTIGTILTYTNIGNLYFGEELGLNTGLLSIPTDIVTDINNYEKLYYTYPALAWTTIFFVKFAYLYFFRQLVDRVKPLIIYWRVVVVTAAISYPICIVSIYIACPKWGLASVECLEPTYFERSLGLAIFDISLDVITDTMIVSLPVFLLWRVNIATRQKVILLIFLSLNIMMAITACIRVSGLHIRGTFDETWLFLWQQIEACVAVSMISLTAFRSVFVLDREHRQQKKARPWYSSTVARLRSPKKSKSWSSEESDDYNGLPEIPSATLTGMRTFIQGGRSKGSRGGSKALTTNREEDDELFYGWPAQKIQVSRALVSHVERVQVAEPQRPMRDAEKPPLDTVQEERPLPQAPQWGREDV